MIEQTASDMSNIMFPIWILIVLIVVGGTLGGCAHFFVNLVLLEQDKIQDNTANKNRKSYIGLCGNEENRFVRISKLQIAFLTFTSMLVGIAGAIGLTGIFALLKVFDAGMLHAARAGIIHAGLSIAGVSTVGGFTARRMLPLIGDNLSKRINDLQHEFERETKKNAEQQERLEEYERELERTKKEQEEAEKKILELNKKAIIDGAILTLRTKSETRWQEAKNDIAKLREEEPESREANILCARFLAEKLPDDPDPPDFLAAINVLTDYINRKNEKDGDVADIVLNRACYYVAEGAHAKEPKEREALRKQAIEDLKWSFSIKGTNKIFAIEDDDLRPLWDDAEFLALVAPYRPKSRSQETVSGMGPNSLPGSNLSQERGPTSERRENDAVQEGVG